MKTCRRFSAHPDSPLLVIEMPAGAQILSVESTRENIYLWALVEDSAAVTKRHFAIRGADEPADRIEPVRYVGMFEIRRPCRLDYHTLHIFDLGEK